MPLDYTQAQLKREIERQLGAPVVDFRILRKSVDARKKDNLFFVLNVEAAPQQEENAVLRRCAKNKNIQKASRTEYQFHISVTPSLRLRPVVVGSGPAGLFCAYALAKAGAQPILLERGKPVEERMQDVARFRSSGILNTESNIQFGEGGAGTFSDGKLTTGIKDPRCSYVLKTLADMAEGEAEDILYMAKPHIGTDRLVKIVKNMRRQIIQAGGTVLFSHKFDDIVHENGILRGILAEYQGEKKEISCNALVLAIGHSARDTFSLLHHHGLAMEQKPYAIGVRIEHKRAMIDRSQYGDFAGHPALGAADYKLSCTPDGLRGVYTFCMCPGGVVVPAASEEGCLAVNGMSEYARNAENSNAALLVGVSPADFPSSHPLAGVELQRKIERAAFLLGGGNYAAPVQLAGDLIKGRASQSLGSVQPSYLPAYTTADLRDCLPPFIIESIRAALPIFGKSIEGYDSYDAVLTGVESRSSSPVRILRDPQTFQASIAGIYPCGEGAGYAGGIVSAAVDGVRCAEKVLQNAQIQGNM